MNRAGVYIHVPFCRARCSYCDFATGAYEAAAAGRYVRAVVKEIERFKARTIAVGGGTTDAPEVDAIYFGGGTPSLLTPEQLARILESVRSNFRVEAGAEVTMEMNPGTVTPDVLRQYRALGVNRASFGAQTFDDRELRRLGRTHTAEDVRRTIADLRAAGFDNVSFDLIAGLPAQSLAAWSRNLDEALSLRPEHLSLYLLEVHEGTPLAAQIKQGRQPAPDEDSAAEMYELMLGRTREAGYEHYEISNFCLPGRESRHNTKYWTGEPVFGFGPSAHSFDGARRRWANERDANAYAALVEAGQSPVVEDNELSEDEAAAESVFLKLRLMRGVDLGAHRARFGTDARAGRQSELARLRDAGLIELGDDSMRLTPRGALFSNEVFAAFV